ncbi:MAG: septal ring lytic transglycosylase RlpA family protein [Steroidobacteraceae bacterium]|nr:septal ring lytic transglycosylase RlpA family protein [Nevskiaceae bacterium]MCP5360503.1 septal ring lytic transglycosylase RlpA family protein [Nevskiaceae bacterium]MCP5472849.1 septal ring lytic transglycosylase RlpA family protein [Nevskiaceae bacterium]
MARRTRWTLAPLVTALLAACGTLPETPAPASTPVPAPAPSATPAPPRDLAAIPDAVPRVEPRSRYGNPASYVVFGRRYYVQASAEGHVERGTASWYGPGFHAARTSSGEPYDMYAMTAAHKTLPLPAYARVTNLRNGRSVVVRINDRGPFVGDRIIDLSYTAAWKLDMLRTGTAPVEVRVLSPQADAAPIQSAAATPAPISVPLPAPAPAPAPVPASVPAAPVPQTPATLPTGSTATAASPAPPGATMLQAGAFFSEANAQALVARLAGAGIDNTLVRPVRSGSRTVWQVRVGPLDSAPAVDVMFERLRLAGIADAYRALD